MEGIRTIEQDSVSLRHFAMVARYCQLVAISNKPNHFDGEDDVYE